MKQSTWWIRVVAVLTLSVISTSPLVSQQPRPYRPSISIGGFNVFIGMSLDSLMKTVGSVFQREFMEPDKWHFTDNSDNGVADVFIKNQRVFQISKYYDGNSSDFETSIVEGLRLAIADFQQLRAAQPASIRNLCFFGETPPRSEAGTPSSFYTRCGYYVLENEIWLNVNGDLMVLVNVRVFSADP